MDKSLNLWENKELILQGKHKDVTLWEWSGETIFRGKGSIFELNV